MKKLTQINEFCKRHYKIGLAVIAMAIIAPQLLSLQHGEVDQARNTYYYDLYYAGPEDADFRYLCSELAAEGECQFQSGNLYEIMFMLPDAVFEEMESGRGDYDIDVTYDSEVEAGKFGYIQVKVFNRKTEQTYIAQSSFEAAEDLRLQEYRVNNTMGERMTFSHYADGVPQGLVFYLDTSSQPEGGSQDVAFESNHSFGKFAWHIAGVNREEF